MRSLIACAVSCARYSAQLGTAVRITRSSKDLQSVAAKFPGSSCDFKVAVVYVPGSFSNESLGSFHGVRRSWIHAQQSLTQDSWSSTEFNDVSAAKVLVATRGIFLQPQDTGLTGHLVLFPMTSWVAMIREPVCELGLLRSTTPIQLYEANMATCSPSGFRSALEAWAAKALTVSLLAFSMDSPWRGIGWRGSHVSTSLALVSGLYDPWGQQAKHWPTCAEGASWQIQELKREAITFPMHLHKWRWCLWSIGSSGVTSGWAFCLRVPYLAAQPTAWAQNALLQRSTAGAMTLSELTL